MTAGRLMFEIASFTTDPEVCPYLHDRAARQRVRIVTQLSEGEYSRLLASGWRRFGSVLFQPACGGCRECVPIRILARQFRPSRSQRRIFRRNRDVHVEIGAPVFDEERLDLYRRFHRERARTRGWPYREMRREEYIETFLENSVETLEFRYRRADVLIGIAYVGVGRDALNSIYAFTDPASSKKSLGHFDVLTEISEAVRRGKQFLYLGFHVRDCQSMSYKSSFKPYELLLQGEWRSGS